MSEPWFSPKAYGYGSGLPIAWQGWAVLAAYFAALAGYLTLLRQLALSNGLRLALIFAGVLALSALLAAICHARTEGGWRWRGGDTDPS